MGHPMNLRRRVARGLGYLADRLAPEDAFRKTCISFEFVTHKGIVTNTEGHGCPLWYQGRANFEKAHERQTERDRQRDEDMREFMQGQAADTTAPPPFPGHKARNPAHDAYQFNFQALPTTTPEERAEWERTW